MLPTYGPVPPLAPVQVMMRNAMMGKAAPGRNVDGGGVRWAGPLAVMRDSGMQTSILQQV